MSPRSWSRDDAPKTVEEALLRLCGEANDLYNAAFILKDGKLVNRCGDDGEGFHETMIDDALWSIKPFYKRSSQMMTKVMKQTGMIRIIPSWSVVHFVADRNFPNEHQMPVIHEICENGCHVIINGGKSGDVCFQESGVLLPEIMEMAERCKVK